MTVVNPKSISGINSITTGSGSDNLLTIHTSDANSTERVRINSSGDVIVGSGITVSPDGDIFATGVTTATTFVGALTGNVTGNISGGTVAGSTGTFTSHVSLGDSDQLRFGDSNDLVIQHNGTDSLITDSGTGDLYIRGSDDIFIQNAGGDKTFATFNDGGTIQLYHNGIEKFSTQSYGIAVDGVVTFTKDADDDTTSTLQINGAAMTSDDYNYIMSATNNSVNCLTMFINGSTRGSDGGNNGLTIRNDNGPMSVGLNGTTHSNFFYTGAAGGIDFSGDGNASGMTSELLDDYEEGTWTPTTPSGGGGWASVSSAMYRKIGNVVFLTFYGGLASQSSTNALKIGGFPYAAAGSNHYSYLYGRVEGYSSSDAVWQVTTGSSDATFFFNNNLVGYNNFSAHAYVLISGFYFAA
jgi:hypothetical protein